MWIISFWVFPVIASCMWLAMLLTMLIHWGAVDGKPHYSSMEPNQTIAYISDVGAQGLKPLFITGSAVTAVFFNLSFVSERWLRHSGQLARNKSWTDKAFAIISIIFALAGGIGLILLSIFDTVNYSRAHNGCLVLFIAGYILSAIFVCAEYQRLGIHYRDHRILAASFWIKLAFIVIEIALAIAFGVTGQRTGKKNTAAILEWVIAFIYTFYVLSFIVDLLPSVRTRHHLPQGKRVEMASINQPPQADADGFVEEPLTTDSMGDRANIYRGYVVDRPTTPGMAQPAGYAPYGRGYGQGPNTPV
ncbi:hypothetical protein AJ79_07089 [Helicocarpus griseus UAMH5409]|uniref:CWH43-like N-terminal domain-containing protein n=1 Tax=Helicocarpus griseus UAMH5409 TaxID=1447875 RepID=A0A2B7X6R6_9EURO|nr:hypothetical protein AJ79_07089 [Helicocarpus griseus UAMH5409]